MLIFLLLLLRSTDPLLCANESQHVATPLALGEKSTWTQRRKKREWKIAHSMGKAVDAQAHSEHAESDGQEISISVTIYSNKPARLPADTPKAIMLSGKKKEGKRNGNNSASTH
jgi:hypothetical protein